MEYNNYLGRYNDDCKRGGGGGGQPRGGNQPFQPPADLRQVCQPGIVKTTWKFFSRFIFLIENINIYILISKP